MSIYVIHCRILIIFHYYFQSYYLTSLKFRLNLKYLATIRKQFEWSNVLKIQSALHVSNRSS